MATPISFTPFYGEENLQDTARKYLLNAAKEVWHLAETELSLVDAMRGWKPLDTMLALFAIGRITPEDNEKWKTIVDDVSYHRMLNNTFLSDLITKISKKMSWALRHCEDQHVSSNRYPGGGLSLEFLVNQLDCDCGNVFSDIVGKIARYLFIFAIVCTDRKERFHVVLYPEGGRCVPTVLICAAQGHGFSIPEEVSYLKRVTLDTYRDLGIVFHGTSMKNSFEIEKQGSGYLSKMTRAHVHFYSTHEMAVRKISVSDLKPSSREYCYIFVGIKQWLEQGHLLWKAPNGVILSTENVPLKQYNQEPFLRGSSTFPVIMTYTRRWQPGYSESHDNTGGYQRAGRSYEDARRSDVPPPPKGPPPRPSSSTSSSPQDGRPPPKAMPKPRPSSSAQAPPPPPRWTPEEAEGSSRSRPRPSSSARFTNNETYGPSFRTDDHGPIDWERETRKDGIFPLVEVKDRYNDTSGPAYYWDNLTTHQLERLEQSGITSEDQWHLHPVSGVISALLRRVWYASKYFLEYGRRPQEDMFYNHLARSRTLGNDHVLNTKYLNGMITSIEDACKNLLNWALEKVPAEYDFLSTGERLQKIPYREFMLLLYIMGSLKKAKLDQPDIFVKYLFMLHHMIGYKTKYGPLRLYITYDDYPVDDDEHNAREDWLVARGLISEPSYRSKPPAPQTPPQDPRWATAKDVVFLDDELEPIFEEGQEETTDQGRQDNDFEVDYDPDVPSPTGAFEVRAPQTDVFVLPNTSALVEKKETKIDVLSLIKFTEDENLIPNIDLNFGNLFRKMMFESSTLMSNVNQLRAYFGIKDTVEFGPDEISDSHGKMYPGFQATRDDIISHQSDEPSLGGWEVPEVNVADATEQLFKDVCDTVMADQTRYSHTEDYLQRLASHTDGHTEELRSVQYMLSRVIQPGECPHPQSNLSPRNFWHQVTSSELFQEVTDKLWELLESVKKPTQNLGYDEYRCLDSSGSLLKADEIISKAKAKLDRLKEIPKEPTPEVFEAEREFYAGVKNKEGAFPYFEKTRHNTEELPGEPTYSLQLGILVLNFGGVSRSKLWNVKEFQEKTSQLNYEDELWNRNRFVDFIGTSGVHVVAVVEAEELASEDARSTLYKKGYRVAFNHAQSHMIGVRSGTRTDGSSTPIQLLVDSSRMEDVAELPEQLRVPRDLQYCIWELDMGIDEKRTKTSIVPQFITRAGIQKVRVLSYHVHHKSPRDHASATVSALQFMWRDAIEYEVDIVCGDANQSAFWFRKDRQNIFNPMTSAITAVGRTYQEVLNKKIWEHFGSHKLSLALSFVSNNSHLTLGRSMKNLQEDAKDRGYTEEEATEDLDCMVTAILSWGHTTCKKIPRSTCDMIRKKIHQELPLGSMDAQARVEDFDISLSEHTLRFGNHHFWLKSSDLSWHRPMQIYLRAIGSPKAKKSVEAIRRKVEKQGRRFDPSRYPSPDDTEVGYRRRPILMKQIHFLEDSEDTQGRPLKRSHEKTVSHHQGGTYGGSSSSSGPRPSQTDTQAHSHEHSDEEEEYAAFARKHADDPAFLGRDPMNDSDA